MTVDKNAFFRQAAIRICGSLNIETALQNCFQYLSKHLPLDAIGLYLYDPGLNVVHRVARCSHDDERIGSVSSLPVGSKDLWSALWEDLTEIRIINRPGESPAIAEAARMNGIGLDISLMVLRLQLEGQRVGLLSLKAKGNDRYEEEHAKLALLLNEPFAIAMTNALKHQELSRLKDMLAEDNRYLRSEIQNLSGSAIIGADLGLRHVMEMVRQVAALDSPVLLLGETGVGKGLIAHAIHYASLRKNGPFVMVNCGAIVDSLIDSELFGHEKGAFTGAASRKKGRFERAEKGTIFLDEIGELPPQAQVRLLHVLQEKRLERVGGISPIEVDVRIISATHRNLQEMIRAGGFREDLWFRLNVFPIHIPPLRQRREDIPLLTRFFIDQKAADLKMGAIPAPAPDALAQLTAYDWPGNVRELENLVERALIRHKQGPLQFDDLMPESRDAAKMPVPDRTDDQLPTLDEVNARHVRQALDACGGKIHGPGGAAEMLGIHPNTLRKRMDKLGIQYRKNKRKR